MSAPLIAPNVARARRRKYQRTPSYVAVSNIEDLGRSFTEELRLTRRTCFKNIQGTSEPVWSPKLEAALLQGLYAYHTRYGEKEIARSLKKNLHRNSFISDFLLNTTNMFRTPKQVASRLQQLRVTTKDKHLQSILSRPAPEPVVKPLASTRPLITAGLNRMTVRLPITVILHDALYPSRPEIVLGPSPQNLWFRALHPCSCVRRGMEPTFILLSCIPLALYSTFQISGGGDKPYWSSITTLSPDGIHDGKWRYVTAIPADLWEVIVERHRHGGRTRYAQWTMLQLIFRADDKSFTRDNPLAELIYDVRPLDDKKPHPDCDYHTQMSIPKALAAKTRLRDTPRTAESSFFPGGSLSKSQEGASVYSNSGTFIERSMVPAVHQPSRTRSNDVYSVYSDVGMFDRVNMVRTEPYLNSSITPTLPTSNTPCNSNVVRTAPNRDSSNTPTLPTSNMGYTLNDLYSASASPDSLSPSFSTLAHWNNMSTALDMSYPSCDSEMTGSEVTTNLHPTQNIDPNLLNETCFEDPPTPYTFGSITGVQTYFATVDNGTHVTLPAAAYSIDGEFMGYYPIHDY